MATSGRRPAQREHVYRPLAALHRVLAGSLALREQLGGEPCPDRLGEEQVGAERVVQVLRADVRMARRPGCRWSPRPAGNQACCTIREGLKESPSGGLTSSKTQPSAGAS